MPMSNTGRHIVEIKYAQENFTRNTIRSINEQCQIWHKCEFVDEELVAEKQGKTNNWIVYPKGSK